MTSRLPAGSTLEISPGLFVPHPQAEVNLPGEPDMRATAPTETLDEFLNVDAPGGESVPAVVQGPLADEVRVHDPVAEMRLAEELAGES